VKLHLAWLSVGAGVVALAVATAPAGANAPGYSLTLSGAPTGTVATPYQITGSGTDPTDQGALYLEIDSFPGSFTTTCPSDYLTASQEASAAGGSFVAFDERENFDSSGNFSNPNAFTAQSPGQWLFCGYTDDGAGDTLATASVIATFSSGTPAQKPVNTTKPRVTRSGKQLRCTRGRWSNSPTHFSYQWRVAGKTKPGATRSRLAITRKLRGHTVRCGVKASNPAGSSSVLSAPFRVH
jgi:hypothetical protein